jgi:hypothetical protein
VHILGINADTCNAVPTTCSKKTVTLAVSEIVGVVNLLEPGGFLSTTRYNIENNSTFSLQSALICLIWISELTAIKALYDVR